MSAVTSHEGISAEYLTKALVNISGGASLTIKTSTPIGTGQMAESYRVVFNEELATGVSSVVVKVPSQNENSRNASRATRCYELETSFYANLREHVDVAAPACLHVRYDAVADDFVLVLEDIVGAAQGDQISGATVEQAESAIDQLISLHTPLWGSKKLDQFAWLPRHSATNAASTSQLLQAMFPSFAQRFAGPVSQEIIALGERLVANIDRYYAAFPEVLTVAHRDFRLDNLLFTKNGDFFDVKVVDWQTVGAMPGASDLGYFIGASFGVDDRRNNEQSLVRRYCAGLQAHNIGIDYSDIWRQYRLLGTSGYIMAIVASVLVKQTARGDAMFAVMANRHGQQMLDLETEKLFA